MRLPDIHEADTLLGRNETWPRTQLKDGRWVPSRPEPFFWIGQRWKAAWLVFTGRADALKWTGQ